MKFNYSWLALVPVLVVLAYQKVQKINEESARWEASVARMGVSAETMLKLEQVRKAREAAALPSPSVSSAVSAQTQ